MAKEQLVEWIKAQQQQGYGADSLRSLLLQQGYSQQDIDDAINSASNPASEATAAPQVPAPGGAAPAAAAGGMSAKMIIAISFAALVVVGGGIGAFFMLGGEETAPIKQPAPAEFQEPAAPAPLQPEEEETAGIVECGQSGDISMEIGEEVDYESDPAWVCFGNSLLDCSEAKVSLNAEGDFFDMEIKERAGDDCIVRLEFGEMSKPDNDIFSNSYVECPMEIENIPQAACMMGACPEEFMPGQTTVAVASLIMINVVFGVETNCTGSLIDKRDSVGGVPASANISIGNTPG